MEGKAGIELPTPDQAIRSMEGGDLVIEIAGEGVADVEVGVSVFSRFVEGILRDVGQFPGFVIERVRPGVAHLCRQTMKILYVQRGLQRVVVGTEIAPGFVNDGEVGELAVVGPGQVGVFIASRARRRGVNVKQPQQVSALGAHITELPYDGRTEAVLQVQVEALRIGGDGNACQTWRS